MADLTTQLATFLDELYDSSVRCGTTATVTGLSVVERTLGTFHTTTFTFANMAVSLTDEAGVIAYGGKKLYDFPAGVILWLGGVADIDLTKSSTGVNANWDGDVGLGTDTAGNNNALAATEQDLIPTTATPQAAAGATTANCKSTATESGSVFDGTGTAKSVYLNFLVDDADHNVAGTACNLIVNGTLKMSWVSLGDY